MSNIPWTEADVDIIKEMGATHTVAAIAERLNRTRNMVIAKASRDKIPLTFFVNTPLVPSWSDEEISKLQELATTMTIGEIAQVMGRTKNQIVNKATELKLSLAQVRIPVEPTFAVAMDVPDEAWQPLPNSTPVRIEDHKEGCRWPIGEKPVMFCGCPTTGKAVYCPDHKRRGTTVTPPAAFNGRRR